MNHPSLDLTPVLSALNACRNSLNLVLADKQALFELLKPQYAFNIMGIIKEKYLQSYEELAKPSHFSPLDP